MSTSGISPFKRKLVMLGLPLLLLLITGAVVGHEGAPRAGAPTLLGIPIEFILFATVLLGVALFHHQTFYVATSGLAAITLYKLLVTGFDTGPGITGLGHHLLHEWVVIANLLCLLLGFVILARHFEKSHVPVILPRYLPDSWVGGFVMLVMVFVISSFLDNIAAALIGGAMAHQLFRGKVHIGFLAAIVAASNAGGSGSVVGDTTTTMMWIDGVDPGNVVHAYVAALVALLFFGIPAAIKQQNFSPIIKNAHAHTQVDWVRLGIVVLILLMAMAVNLTVNLRFPELADSFPFLGVAVWVAILISLPFRRPDLEEVGGSVKGTIFLLSLVLSASMMPVEKLPLAAWHTTFGLGFVSAVFDNIPLTALALHQGGYDWGMLAYAVGFGGSMIWFGSSAGVALTNMFPEGKSVWAWVREGWYVTVGYILGFLVMLAVVGWHPHPPHKAHPPAATAETSAASPH